MENEIHFTNKEFDFTKITLSQPIAIQGGAYFTKIKFNSEPLYIQTSKCVTKQGVNETSKKAYVDLMYTKDDEEIVEWFETLESTLVNLIFQKKHLWFQDDVEYGDIENFFNPITRAYKGGKYHLIRTSIVKNKNTNQYTCNVYDENENILPITDIKENNLIIPIVELLGIKFSARSFQLDIIGKQMMVLNNKQLFNSCLIKRKQDNKEELKDIKENTEYLEQNNSVSQSKNNYINNGILESEVDNSNLIESNTNIIEELLHDNESESNLEETKDIEDNKYYTLSEDDEQPNNNTIEKTEKTEKTIYLEESDDDTKTDTLEISNMNDLEDISEKLTIHSNEEITLKKPNEVYYEIYKIAKQKAKQHKKAAISAYLEAKKIKNTYLLEDLDNSDSSEDEGSDSDSDNIKDQINDIIEELN